MPALLAFALTLLVAVLLSALAHRSILSISVLFLLSGFAFGSGGLGWLPLEPRDPAVSKFIEIAMFGVLFADGMEVRLRDLRKQGSRTARALLIGMPLAIAGMALLGRFVVGLPWLQSFLLAAALSPTDPVLASALVGREEAPERLRNLLNLESGLNDGLALPVVVTLLALAGRDDADPLKLLGEVALGVAIGIVVPWIVIRLERSRFFSTAGAYGPLLAFAIGLLVLAAASLTHANLFLAAFTAGMMVETFAPHASEDFDRLGEGIAELLKLAALMVFGSLITLRLLAEVPLAGYVFAFLALFLARPLSLAISLAGSGLGARELAAASWFGPRGFASVFFSLLILASAVPHSERLFQVMAVVITASIVLHSSTDVLVARWFEKEKD
ncbi:MAG: cation:proton antiporter [Thermoanaerobaculia bacterium]